MVVGRRDQRHVRVGAARFGHLGRDFGGGQHTAFAGFGALANLDLDHPCGIQETRVHAKAPGGHLLPARQFVLSQHIGQFAALAIDAHNAQPFGGVGIGAVGQLAL